MKSIDILHSIETRFNNIKQLKAAEKGTIKLSTECSTFYQGIPKWVLTPFKIPKNVIFKQIGSNGLKREHYLVLRKEDREKKYISNFISNFTEDFSDFPYYQLS